MTAVESELSSGRWRALVTRAAAWVAFALGLLLPLAFAPFDLWPLAVICPAGLFWLWKQCPPRRAAWLGFLFSAGTFLAGTYWLYISIHVFGKAPLAVAVFLMLGLVAIMGAYTAILGYVGRRWLVRDSISDNLLIWPAAWVLVEWLRGWFMSGFPWLSLGYSQIDSPLAGLAPVLGVYGVSWAVVLSAGVLVVVLRSTGNQARILALSIGAGVWLLAFGLGVPEWTEAGDDLKVSVIQGGISQDRKWLPEQRQPTLELYRKLSRQHFDSDLIVWPEAAIPALLHEVSEYLRALQIEAREHDTDLLIGVLAYDFESQQYRNAVIALNDRVALYYKRHLVPFGEYFPVPDVVRSWMRLMSLPYVDFAAGSDDQVPPVVGGQPVSVSICYEDAFGSEQLAALPEATLLVNVSNDAWFGDSTAPHQHLQIAQMRTMESRRFQLRATNTGISAVIAPNGRIMERSAQFAPEVLTAVVQARYGSTPYLRWGNWAVCLLTLVCILAALAPKLGRQSLTK